ncbi:MAG: lipopolysaccharide biosynthesis protein [Ardenticatenaceae bacterium]|nr:lipopolysaccharide biosynthesis protein [Ardenticatenaceae bacterium]MCB9442670.1 lipopolysaccharide biosynthesis protein [Ardenticatenaceae bacterium]
MLRLAVLRLLESYFRHRWLYLLPIVLLTILGGVYIVTAKPEYRARGVVYVQQETLLSSLTAVAPDGFTWMTAADASASQLNELLQTDSFVRAIIMETDLEENMNMGRDAVVETILKVRESVWAQSIGSNQMLITASSENAEIAYQLVNAVVENHIQWQVNASRQDSVAAQEFFADLIEKYQQDLETTQQELDDYLILHPEPVRGDRPETEVLAISRLQSKVDLATNRYSSALDKEEEARLALAQTESVIRQTYFLIDAPSLPEDTETSKKDLAITLAIFMVAGGVLSVIGVVGGALIDRTFRFPSDVEHLLELPVLTSISAPPRERRKRRKSKEAAVAKPAEVMDVDTAVELKDRVAV